MADFLQSAIAVSVGIFVLWSANWLLIRRYAELGSEKKFSRQLIMMGVTLIVILLCLFFMPIERDTRNDLLGIIGIILSGLFAFSSTTIIANLMSGIVLRITKPFRIGDFIQVNDYFGRVSERGLFHTEIQTETRDLITIPNSYCMTNPVTTTRSSGTIIAASLSLGYDLNHKRIESLLIDAARLAGLDEPFVHILQLGDFSVTYRVSGFLENPKHLLSVRSGLYASVLDTLHGANVEIMSPTFMNQRQLRPEERSIPRTTEPASVSSPRVEAETIVFDKAEQAEQTENQKDQLKREIERLEMLMKTLTDEAKKASTQGTIKYLKGLLEKLDADAS